MTRLLHLPDTRRDAPDLATAHRVLAEWNRTRWGPALPAPDWRREMAADAEMRALERAVLETARAGVAERAAQAPSAADDFVEWFEALERAGPGQHDPLFDWLAEDATLEDVRWFVAQELSGEAGFDDLVAYTQVQMPEQAKLELARNYWDEMGRGDARGMHGPMLQRLADELDVSHDLEAALTEPLTLANLMAAMAANRGYAFHSVGALGVIELTAPARAAKVTQALKRLAVRPKARQYFAVHAVLDIRHSEAWNREVLRPLVAGDPRRAAAIAEGALIRLECGKACFDAYRAHLWPAGPALRRAS